MVKRVRIDNRKNHHLKKSTVVARKKWIKKKSKKKNIDGTVTSSIYENRQNEFQVVLMDVVALKVPFALKLLVIIVILDTIKLINIK